MVVVQTRGQSLFFFVIFCGVFLDINLEKMNALYRNISFGNLLRVTKYLYILYLYEYYFFQKKLFAMYNFF
jgi:hypothetical protein